MTTRKTKASSDGGEVRLILGDQLLSVPTAAGERAIMIEHPELCTHFRYHKKKIVLFLTAMRDYADALRSCGVAVHYVELPQAKTKSYMEELQRVLEKERIQKIWLHQPADRFFTRGLQSLPVSVRIEANPVFLNTDADFRDYLGEVKKPFMKTFYERARRRHRVLVDAAGKPLGGKWSFDEDNRKPYPKAGLQIPSLPPVRVSPHLKTVEALVEAQFPDHPGEARGLWLPTTREGALQWLQNFIVHRLERFGPYEDAIAQDEAFLYHSTLSPLINMGLLTPKEVLAAVLKAFEKGKADMPSVEGFVRQLIGWREFIKGVDTEFGETQEKSNFWGHQRKMGPSWYSGSTGIDPVDQVIKRVLKFGYCHHIERLMVLSNVMLLAEIHPRQVHRWFMEMFLDSADWVMGPNIYGMGQFSDGGIFATKPYIGGSNYILKMSDYKKGPWCEVLDGLYWSFISKHKKFYAQNPRMSVMVKALDKLDPVRRKRIFDLAERFREGMET